MSDLRDIGKQLLQQWQRLSGRARLLTVGAVGVVLTGLLTLSLTSGRVEWAPLYAGLAAEDGAAVVEKLNELKVPNQLARGGEVIEVPRERVAEMRLTLAGQGLPRGGAVGYELFDKQGLGVSDFAQKVQYHRALQGELERSIATLGAVQKARVHLVVPEKNLFRTTAESASASVVVQLHKGRALSPEQVQGVVHLVASSVEGLRPERVTVLDGRGAVLSQKSGGEALASATLSVQREIEETTARRAQELLERTVGKGHAAVQVSAQIDPSQIERTDEDFSPEGQVVRSEQDVDDTVGPSGDESAEGVAGARGNLPGGPPPQVTPSGGSRRRSQTRNYEISKATRKTTQPVGRLERLTVAVLVDGKYEAVAGPPGRPGPPADKERKFVPRSKEELDAYAAIVKEAVGYNEKRGDQVEVRCVPFAALPGDGDGGAMSDIVPVTSPWLYAAGAAAAMALLGGAAVALSRRRRDQVLPAGMVLPASVNQLEASLNGPPKALSGLPAESTGPSQQVLRQQAMELLEQNPERAVHVLRAWIHEPVETERAEQPVRAALPPRA